MHPDEIGLDYPDSPLPERTLPPSWDVLEEMADDGEAFATDGCIVETDGECHHGAQSWLLVLGCI